MNVYAILAPPSQMSGLESQFEGWILTTTWVVHTSFSICMFKYMHFMNYSNIYMYT